MLSKSRIKYILIFLMFLTSSFDIFLNVNIATFNFRFTQIVSFPLIILALINLKGKNAIKPLGISAFLGWFLFLTLSMFNTPIIKTNIAYHLWLVLDYLIVFMMTNITKDEKEFHKIFKLYLYSFAIMAGIGIVQFLLPFVGIKDFFIRQWWIPNTLPRVNAFSYEPSYYATYMLMGWVIFRVLLKKIKNFIEYKNKIILGFVLTSVAMVLSTSRMGILMIIVFEILNILYNIINDRRKLADKKVILKRTGFIVVSILVIVGVIYFINENVYNLRFLLNGTGLAGTSAHSFVERYKGMIDTFEVFKQSPFIGYGLGGVYTAVAELNGFDIYTVAVQDVGDVLNIFVEVLAASGIIGFIFFLKYCYDLVYDPIILAIRKLSDRNKTIMLSIVISFIFELIILVFNQNILRIYLWIDIAVLCMTYSLFKQGEIDENINR